MNGYSARGRIRWEDGDAGDILGYVGTIKPSAFRIYKPAGFRWVLIVQLPGMPGNGGYGDSPGELKPQAEELLIEFAASLGAIFPDAEAGRGMLAPDAVATYAAMLEAIDPDPGRRAALRSELAQLTTERREWEETALACVCSPGRCTRSKFRDHQGDSPGCLVCADLDPGQPCYAAVIARLETGDEAAVSDARVPLESEGLRQVEAYLDQADSQGPEAGQ